MDKFSDAANVLLGMPMYRAWSKLAIFVTVAWFALVPNVARAQQDQYSNCAQIQEPANRLSCYDNIAGQTAKKVQKERAETSYTSVNLIDLKVDKKQMLGQKVSVRGMFQLIGETGLLKSDMMDMSPLWVALNHLPRDDRKRIFQNCSTICEVSIRGTIGRTDFDIGVIADALLIN